uniref:Fatty acyl-CoA reductase n=1 Tax=Culicoides sonorensis TaxID=179676 RepID=A0A336LUX5_CULSO
MNASSDEIVHENIILDDDPSTMIPNPDNENIESQFPGDTISNFYRNSVVLITGGTGFLGKVLIEKLLRVFDVKKIYLLIRHKNNMNANDRLQALLNESIVFNIVASVKFNEKLKSAIDINILGTQKVMEIAKDIQNLKAFLHISTLYSNCNRQHIDEKVYEMEIGYEKIIQISRILNPADLEKVKHCLLDGMPNTYTMTKRCAEIMVFNRAKSMPSGIFRPPIVISTYKEPVRGWTDNVYGPSGVCLWAVKGLIHVIWGDKHRNANMVPVDYCINAMVCAAWDVNRRFKEALDNGPFQVPIYNYLYSDNNLTWGKYMKNVRRGLHQPLEKSLWYYSYIIAKNSYTFKPLSFLFHTVPGYFLDGLAFLAGKPRIYTSAYQKIVRNLHSFSYFGLIHWTFSNSNIQLLHRKLPNHERNILEFDLRTVNWTDYFYNYVPGIKKYYYKEDMTKVIKWRQHYLRLKILHYAVKIIFWVLLVIKGYQLSHRKLFKQIAKHF